MRGLYIHIPFCKKICTYCDFYKRIAGGKLKEKYVDMLIQEMDLRANMFSDITTLYLGGGTPSVLDKALLERLYDKLSTVLNFECLQESTIEVNPEDISEELSETLAKNKVNRVSIGIQGFNQKKLDVLGRNHTYDQIEKGIEILRSYGINNINLDLMYAISGFTIDDLDQEIDLLLSLKPNHISTYSLQLEPHTILYNRYLKGEFQIMDEELESKMYYHIIERLANAGFVHYEISNFSLPGYESRHNLIYWKNEHYLGLGASASYYIDDTRYTSAKNMESYFAGVICGNLFYDEVVKLTKEEVMSEELILGLRLIEGVSEKHFYDKFGISIYDAFPEINRCLEKQLLVKNNGKIAINYPYLYLGNYVLGEILKDK